MYLNIVLWSALLSFACAIDRKFPPNFLFGAATSAYQIEGAWNSSGKGESIWDRFVHSRPEVIVDRTNGDVAADSYNKWERDVAACVEMGLQFYRFSIAWTRILPTGLPNKINKAGVQYYNNLINALLENNIEPMVTLYHWGLPQMLQDLGGWTNPLIVDWFASYAEIVFSLYGDRVKYWITINEPAVVCEFAYAGVVAPGIQELVLAPYLCNKYILLAHAKAWRIYDEQFRSMYHGRVSLSNHLVWYVPASESMKEITELAREFLTGRYSHPIYSKEGGWPPSVEEFMAKQSKKQGFNSSRLPAFTEEEREFIKGTYDFYGMNQYTARVVRKARPGDDLGFWFASGSHELNVVLEMDPKWKMGSSSLMAIYPPAIRKQLAWVKKRYGDLDIIITENGYSNSGSLINDPKRMEFIHDYLEQVLMSIKIDKVNVIAYTYWSLIDNFEWMDGYRTKFGLFEVNFTDPDLPRIPRKSAVYYASIIRTHTLIDPASHSIKYQNIERNRWKEQMHNKEHGVQQNGRQSVSQNGGQGFVRNKRHFVNILVLFIFTVTILN